MRTLLLFSAILIGSADVYGGDLSLSISTVQDTIAAREPLELAVVISNPSDKSERIMGISEWGMQMMSLHFEVVDASGRVSMGHYLRYQSTGILIPSYPGEPLPAGSALRTYLYPTRWLPFEHSRRTKPLAEDEDLGFPFAVPGSYKVRVCYVVWEGYENLWKPPGGELCSEYIPIFVRRPTVAENAILDAYWQTNDWAIVDEEGHASFDLRSIEQALREYPAEELAKYLHLAVMRSSASRIASDPSVLREMEHTAEVLATSHPGFRTHVVALHLAEANLAAGNRVRALVILYETLARDPALLNSDAFMITVIRAEAPNPLESAGAVDDWHIERQKGRDRFREKYRHE